MKRQVKIIGLMSIVMFMLLPQIVGATTVPNTEPLSCVEVGWVVDNNTRFGIRNQCDQRIYVKIFDGTTAVNSEFLDRGQWFPITQGRTIQLFDGEANYQAGTVARSVELNQDIYCQTLPEGKVVAECANYVAPTPEVSPTPEATPTPETTPSVEVTPSETTDVEAEVETTLIKFLEQPLVGAGAIFVGVIILATLAVLAVQRLRKPKGIYLRERKRRKFRK